MRILKQSTGANVMVLMVDSTDHVTGKAGLTLTITASKDGGAFGSISPSVTDRGDGWYNLALTASHTDTLGDLALHITGTAADPADTTCRVVVRDFADLAYPATSGRSLAVESDGMVYADLREWIGTAPLSLASQRVEALMGAITAGVIDAAAIGTGAIDADAIAAGAITSSEAPALANLDVSVSSRGTADPGDAMTLTGAYDLAKTAAQAGDAMSLTGAAVTAIMTALGTWAYQAGKTFAGLLVRMRAFIIGKTIGHNIGHPQFKDSDDATTILEADVDTDGNRSNVDAHGE